MKRFLGIVIAILSICSCSYGDHYLNRTITGKIVRQCNFPVAFGITKNVPEEYRESIRKGFKYWNDEFQESIFFDFGDIDWSWGPQSTETDGFLAVGIVSDEDFPSPEACAVASIRHKYDCYTVVKIFLRKRCMKDSEKIQTIIRHEAGHVLGLAHFPARWSLMYSKALSNEFHPVSATSRELLEIWNLYKDMWKDNK